MRYCLAFALLALASLGQAATATPRPTPNVTKTQMITRQAADLAQWRRDYTTRTPTPTSTMTPTPIPAKAVTPITRSAVPRVRSLFFALLLASSQAHAVTTEALVVAGGGGGGAGFSGGGGGGGVLTSTALSLTDGQTYTVVIGVGGVGNANGGDSWFASLTATGGGRGASDCPQLATSGGSGGGGVYLAGYQAAGAGTAGQGYIGGAWTSGVSSGGGGGAGQAGAAGTTTGGGKGGDGLASSISGAAQTFGGGGGGSFFPNCAQPAGAGGAGGGGAGQCTNNIAGTAGTANTGGGGGGSGGGSACAPTHASGGSGVVFVRYLTSYGPAGTGGTITYVDGYTIHRFTSTGSFVAPVAYTPTITPTSTQTPTITQTFTNTATPTFTITATSSHTQTITQTSTFTQVASATQTPTPTASPTRVCANYGTTTPGGNLTFSNGVISFKKLVLSAETVVQTASVYVVSGKGQLKMAVYESDAQGFPGELLHETAVGYVSTGWNTQVFSATLPAGSYWVACMVSGGVTVRYARVGQDVFQYRQFGPWPDPAHWQTWLGNVASYTTGCQ